MVKIVPIRQKLAEQQARNCKADIATRSTRLTTRSNDAIQRRDLRRDPTTRSNDAIQRRDLMQTTRSTRLTTRFDANNAIDAIYDAIWRKRRDRRDLRRDLTQTTRLTKFSIRQWTFSNWKLNVTTEKSSIFYLACLIFRGEWRVTSNLRNRCWKVRL